MGHINEIEPIEIDRREQAPHRLFFVGRRCLSEGRAVYDSLFTSHLGMVLQEGIALLGAELGVAKKIDPGKGGFEHDGGIYVEAGGQIVAEVE